MPEALSRAATATKRGVLSFREKKRLADLERTIADGLQTFIRVGMALAKNVQDLLGTPLGEHVNQRSLALAIKTIHKELTLIGGK